MDKLPPLLFDHKDMIQGALKKLRAMIGHMPISFQLLPKLFTLTQLQLLYEAILGEKIDKRNFRKRVSEMSFIEKTDKIDKLTSKRGAALYRFNVNVFKHEPVFKL